MNAAAGSPVTVRRRMGAVVGRELDPSHSPVVAARVSARAPAAQVLSNHAWRRIVERLKPSEQQEFFRRMDAVMARAPELGHDYGIRLLRLGGQRNDAWSNQSNGDEVWVVIRRGEIKTVMLRRSSQPPTAWALGVDKVVFL